MAVVILTFLRPSRRQRRARVDRLALAAAIAAGLLAALVAATLFL